ncbi:hypothetical protein KIN20_004788 [Parelaphostrongylus tenuis]|uniref:SHSP domain-containing protein n=1 Tax=Parelaphostrongylus tenuis TaxID=148309 RepID=A0AAD5MHH7_PARTN|nr:hypothetical protein KIN20_004788 [Parelaphostrongylus tenuis]
MPRAWLKKKIRSDRERPKQLMIQHPTQYAASHPSGRSSGTMLEYPYKKSEGYSKIGPQLKIVDNESKFAVSLDVSKFKPENLKVKLDGHHLTIEGKEELKEKNGYSAKAFIRQFELPEDVNLNAIRSSLTDSGQLSVEVPKLTKASESGARSIPIEHVGEK